MSYSINYDFREKFEGSDYELMSFDCVLENEDLLTQTEEFEGWIEYMGYKKNEGVDEKEFKESLIEEFKNSDSYYDLRDSFIPMVNEIEVLQNKPTDKQIELVEKYAPVASVIHEYNLDFYGLGLRGCGMDLSEYLELAYYIIDGVSPIKARSIISLSGKAKELLEFCRDTVKKDGSISFYKIQDFLTKDKGEGKWVIL